MSQVGVALIGLSILAELIAPYCPADSPIRAAAPDYQVIWERME